MSATQGIATPEWAERLVRVLRAQRSLVERLDGLAARQGALIRDQQADALVELLAQRQAIIDRFGEVQVQINELTRGMEGRVETLDAPLRSEIRSLINTIGERLTAVMSRDAADQDLLEAGRADVRRQMQTLDRGAAARDAYVRRADGRTNLYADRKG